MKTILFLLLATPISVYASVMGVSTHPLNEEARVLSAEMTGYMSQRHEMGMGLRYTHEVSRYRLLDVSVAGGQDSRGLLMGTGMDFELLSEDINQPRISLKPFYQYQKFESQTSNLLGVAPSIRKGFAVNGQEFFPFLALPTGLKIDGDSNEFEYHASLSFGMSMPIQSEKLLLSVEGNRNMGAASDYVGCLVSWVWH